MNGYFSFANGVEIIIKMFYKIAILNLSCLEVFKNEYFSRSKLQHSFASVKTFKKYEIKTLF